MNNLCVLCGSLRLCVNLPEGIFTQRRKEPQRTQRNSVVFFKKRMGATYVGVRRAHPYSWLLSSPQQPLETEDPPTVSLAPQYTSQRLCRARAFLLGTSD